MTLLPTVPPSSRDRAARQLATPSSICITGVMFSEGMVQVSRSVGDAEACSSNDDGDEEKEKFYGIIRYRIFRPRQFQMLPAPLVVLHGGPGVPSNYLMSVVNVITDRAVIFYDQLGCGRSSRIMDIGAYSIESHVDDLEALLKHWKLKHYHLLGHSFGGIVAFEYLKRCSDRYAAKCLSLTMSSAPTETKMVEEEAKRLLRELMVDCPDEEVHAAFSQTHECRAVPTPLALTDAYAQAATLWRGTKAIPNYKASGLVVADDGTTSEVAALPPIKTPCHILRGQYDFVTEPCVEGWGKLFPNSQSTVLAGCSHHALLENEQLYGDVILAFMDDYDL
jgi:proline iminopeptidase